MPDQLTPIEEYKQLLRDFALTNEVVGRLNGILRRLGQAVDDAEIQAVQDEAEPEPEPV